MHVQRFTEAISEHVWRNRYRWSEPDGSHEPGIDTTWGRVALAVSGVEPYHRDEWREKFRGLLDDFYFLPGGRILANAGAGRSATLFNCFVCGVMEDSISGIFGTLREAMITMQAGGGIGVDFSTVRPAGMPAVSSGGVASGPVSFMHVWEQASATLESTSNRRGAMMATLRCDHPDIEAFIDAKRRPGVLAHFNLSVLVTDEFLHAVESDAMWPLVFPLHGRALPEAAEVCVRRWSAAAEPQPCLVMRRISAKELWGRLADAAHASAEPGVLFVDRINRCNNLWYCERVSAVNPCGEVPLPPHGACNLGSLNLTRFVEHPFSEHPQLNFGQLIRATTLAVRFLDNVYELSSFPVKAQQKVAHASRRLGLGITGLADMMLMLGLRYGSASSLELTEQIMRSIRDAAYRASVELAREKGAFPEFNATQYGAAHFILDLPHDIQQGIATYGIRNSHLIAAAPAGSISLLANNVSSGIEPVFAFDSDREVHAENRQAVSFRSQDNAVALFRTKFGASAKLPDYFVTAADVSCEDQLAVQAAVQAYADNAVSKTLQLPEEVTTAQVGNYLLHANQLGLKGCAVFRTGGAQQAVVRAASGQEQVPDRRGTERQLA
jgi:ribonucleoside-diphosphate reductase alpha chain